MQRVRRLFAMAVAVTASILALGVGAAGPASAVTVIDAPVVDGTTVTWDVSLGGNPQVMLCSTTATQVLNGLDGCIMVGMSVDSYLLGAAGQAKYSTPASGTSHTFAAGDAVEARTVGSYDTTSTSLPGGSYKVVVFSGVTGNYTQFGEFVVPGGAAADEPGLVAPLQQFSVAAGTSVEECADLAPASSDWEALGSLRHDGWSVSWAQWPHGGAGGPVCTRQPMWTGSAWRVEH